MEGPSSSSSSFALATLLILYIVVISHMTSCSGARTLGAGSTSTKFIKTSCGATTYPQLCFSSLFGYASTIQASHKLLAHTALSVTLEHARSTSTMMSTMSKSNGMKPGEVGAMRDCVEEITDCMDELQKSLYVMGHLRGSTIRSQMSDIQTWVSAALTEEDTCMEGFAGNGLNGNVKSVVRGRMVNMVQLTSNALALINSYASKQPHFK